MLHTRISRAIAEPPVSVSSSLPSRSAADGTAASSDRSPSSPDPSATLCTEMCWSATTPRRRPRRFPRRAPTRLARSRTAPHDPRRASGNRAKRIPEYRPRGVRADLAGRRRQRLQHPQRHPRPRPHRRAACTRRLHRPTRILNDPYTGKRIVFRRGVETSAAVQIDHRVPLALAWRSGAWRVTDGQRAAFRQRPCEPRRRRRTDQHREERLRPRGVDTAERRLPLRVRPCLRRPAGALPPHGVGRRPQGAPSRP